MTRLPNCALHLALALACAGLGLSSGGCDPFDPDLGESPSFRCGDNNTCPEGYECIKTNEVPTGLCMVAGAATDTDTGGDGDGDGDASALCDEDRFESNDTARSATATLIPTSSLSFVETGLAVCPGGDVDLYRLRVGVDKQNIRAELTTQRADGVIKAELTNEQGTTLATGTYNATGTLLTVELANAAVDSYFLRVSGADDAIAAAYDLALTLSGP